MAVQRPNQFAATIGAGAFKVLAQGGQSRLGIAGGDTFCDLKLAEEAAIGKIASHIGKTDALLVGVNDGDFFDFILDVAAIAANQTAEFGDRVFIDCHTSRGKTRAHVWRQMIVVHFFGLNDTADLEEFFCERLASIELVGAADEEHRRRKRLE